MKRGLIFLLALFLLFMPISVSADTGPKPSVTISFVGLQDENYYVTLLSADDKIGPWSIERENVSEYGEDEVFQKFCEYEDSDGYYFLGMMDDCSDDDVFKWGYYPPSKFKILLYFPEYESFMITESIYEQYAFDSYFTVDVSEDGNNTVMLNEDGVIVDVQKSYDYTTEVVSLIIRVIITIAIEVLIALLFKYRNKKALAIIFVTNIVTQIVLNLLLNIINYNRGEYAFTLFYALVELLVFAIEGALYYKLLGGDKSEKDDKYMPIKYAAIANVASLLLGLWIANIIPKVF